MPPIKLSSAQLETLKQHPVKFTFDAEHASQIAKGSPEDRAQLAAQIAQTIGRDKDAVLAKLNQLARVTVVTIDW